MLTAMPKGRFLFTTVVVLLAGLLLGQSTRAMDGSASTNAVRPLLTLPPENAGKCWLVRGIVADVFVNCEVPVTPVTTPQPSGRGEVKGSGK
jgi:hypothetical protein